MKKIFLLILLLLRLFCLSRAQQTLCTNCPTLVSYSVTNGAPNSVTITATVENSGYDEQTIQVSTTNSCGGICKEVPHGRHTYTFGPLAGTAAQVRIKLFANDECEGTPCNLVTLPITLQEFTAQRTTNGAELHWKTASETNNAGFSIERLAGESWQEIAFVQTKAANGTSTEPLEYAFTDRQTLPDVTQYRLKQTDRDGTFAYSKIAAVPGSKQSTVKLFPNPIHQGQTVLVIIPMNRTVQSATLLTTDGKTIREWQSVTGTLALTDLKSGMYVLHLRSGTTAPETHTIVVQ